MSTPSRVGPGRAFLRRHRATVVIALIVAFVASGTAAAVSYLVLGATNTASTTTTMRSGVNKAVLQVTNTNTAGGTSARGIGVTVPAGRAPITVNTGAGTATNLSADKLDGIDSTGFARGKGVRVVANRIVGNHFNTLVPTLLLLPGLGQLTVGCMSDGNDAEVYWLSVPDASTDVWDDRTGVLVGAVVGPNHDQIAARWTAGASSQVGTKLVVGRGTDPGPRQTAEISLVAYRPSSGADCHFQATATLWSAP